MDYKKIGEQTYRAWVIASENQKSDQECAEADGRAALAAIIPEPENGQCNQSCPFWTELGGSITDLTTPDYPGCKLNFDEISDVEPEESDDDGPLYDYMIKPGPRCPVYKE